MRSPSTTGSQTDFLVSRGAMLHENTGSAQHFGDQAAEFAAFSESTVMVDRTPGSRLLHEGPDALDLLHRLSTNDLLQLEPGKSLLTVLTSERGRIIDVFNVAAFDEERLLLLSESPDPKDSLEWIDRFTIIEDATLRDISSEFVQFAVIGPKASAEVHDVFGVQLDSGAVSRLTGEHEGVALVASRWGGLDRVDVVAPPGTMEACWDGLAAAGVRPAGDAAFHAARISRGVPFPGFELNDSANPLEAGLKSLISFTKGCYIGQEVVARLDTYDKLQKRLVGLETGGSLNAGARLTSGGKRAGTVTSVSPLETGNSTRALGYVRRDHWTEGAELESDGTSVTVHELPDAR